MIRVADSKGNFDWRDPLLFDDLLDEEERLIQDLSLIHI